MGDAARRRRLVPCALVTSHPLRELCRGLAMRLPEPIWRGSKSEEESGLCFIPRLELGWVATRERSQVTQRAELDELHYRRGELSHRVAGNTPRSRETVRVRGCWVFLIPFLTSVCQ